MTIRHLRFLLAAVRLSHRLAQRRADKRLMDKMTRTGKDDQKAMAKARLESLVVCRYFDLRTGSIVRR